MNASENNQFGSFRNCRFEEHVQKCIAYAEDEKIGKIESISKRADSKSRPAINNFLHRITLAPASAGSENFNCPASTERPMRYIPMQQLFQKWPDGPDQIQLQND
uniref:Uncharacterized protein n=1 Tax=Romanomermis culicivorax TaxID=13658 RepID=A0A915IWR0_ROMCU